MTQKSENAGPQTESIIDQMGGVSGLIYSTVPIIVFVPANAAWGLQVATIAALAAAAAIMVLRLVRREPVMPAVSGAIGVGVCVFIANRTGDASGYFLFGIWMALASAIAMVVSIIVRWPLIGVLWSYLNGSSMRWRKHRRTLLAYDIATAFWALVFLARYLTQSELYDEGATGWLAAARIAMGWPLTGIAVVVTVLLVGWAGRSGGRDAVRPAPTTG